MNAINPAQQAEAEAKRYDIEFPVLVCRETGVLRDYQVTKLPQLFIIDRKGVIQESKLFLKMEQIRDEIDTLLAEQKKANLKE